PVWIGRFYEVWQRPAFSRVIEHLSLGSDTDPQAVPDCVQVERLAAVAANAGGELGAASRPAPQGVRLAAAARPGDWPAGVTPGTVLPEGGGTLNTTIALATSGRDDFWLGGSFRDRVSLLVDGKRVGSARHQLEETAQLVPLGSTRLGAGVHSLQ